MTATESAALVGLKAWVKLETLRVECVICDVKSAYGAERLLIEPTRGFGRQWVDRSRLSHVGKDMSILDCSTNVGP